MSSSQNELAKQLRALHVPGNPVVFTNCYDAATAKTVASNPSTRAMATASYAIAACQGFEDNDMTLDVNLNGIGVIASVAAKAKLPLSADLQDAYDDVTFTVTRAIKAGAVGGNIEDVDNKTGKLRSVEEAAARIRQAVQAAESAGVPDFCVNARTDVLGFGGSVEDAVSRGKAYLAAGALTVFVWGGTSGRGVSSAEVKQLVDGLGGMVNVKMNLRPGFCNAREIAELGVARISLGPELFHKAMAGYRDALGKITERSSF